MQYLEICCRAFLVVVFTWSVAGKVRSRESPDRLAGSLAPLLGLLPLKVPGRAVAVGLLAAEALAVVLLLAAPAAGLGLASGLSAVLAAGVAVVARRGLDVRCRCFGGGDERIGGQHVVRNVLILLVGCAGLAARLSAPGGRVEAPGVALAVVAAGIAAALVVRLDDLVDLFAPARPRRP